MLPVLVALILIATAGASLAIDVGRAYSLKSDMQGAADAAALAAAVMLPDVEAARKAAMRAVTRSLPGSDSLLNADDFEFGSWNAEKRSIVKNEDIASAVRVTVQRTASRGNAPAALFSGFLSKSFLDIKASATAGKRGVACLITLSHSGKGLELNRDAELKLKDCGAQINSKAKDAFKASGKSSLISDSICVSGGAKVDGGADVEPMPSEGCPPHVDPMAGLLMPEVGGCTDDEVVYADETITLTADRVFCGGLKLTGNTKLTLNPGLYVIDNGKLEIQNNAMLVGDGVTILLHGEKAEMDIKHSAALRLKAPVSGPMQGLLIIQDKGSKKENKWDSKAMSELRGVVYLPKGKFTSEIEANITGTDACFVLIANEIKIDGKANMSIDLSSKACKNSLPSAFSRSIVLLN